MKNITTPRRFQKWLRERIQWLTDWSRPLPATGDGIETSESWPGPDPDSYISAAEIVEEAGEIALQLGLLGLYEQTRVPKGVLGFDEAKVLLTRCLLALDGTSRKRRNTSEKMAHAIWLTEQHPAWTKSRIAAEVGVDRRTLNNWSAFETAWRKSHVKATVRTGTRFNGVVETPDDDELRRLIKDQARDGQSRFATISR